MPVWPRSRGARVFGVAMPPLNIYSLGYNFLTGQPMRARTWDGEVSWDQPGPLFDREQSCLERGTLGCDAFNTPTELRAVIGHLVACPNNPAYQAVGIRPLWTVSAMANILAALTAAWSFTETPTAIPTFRPERHRRRRQRLLRRIAARTRGGRARRTDHRI